MSLSQIQIPDVGSLVQFGVAGVMLMWFMFRVERRLDNHTQIIGDLAKSILLDVLSRDSLSEPVRTQAQALMESVTERSARKN